MTKNQYVLVLPSWYPSKVDVFNGDFNKRTVEALSFHLSQIVIYVVADKTILSFKEDRVEKDNLITITGYFPKSYFKIIDFFRYLRVYYKLVNQTIKKNGKPSYIHTYVFFPAGIISFYFSKKLKIKNVLTEHWSIIYPENEFSISKRNFFFKFFLKYLIQSFDLILPVVEALRSAILFWAPKVENIVIPNVVDTSLFFLSKENKYAEFTFIHVSSMEPHKNPLGLLCGFESYFLLNKNSRLKLIGPIKKELLNKVSMSQVLKSKVEFLGEMSNDEVASIMQRSHVLVMNSFYESQPCVILEALCCGLPIISSNVGGISEIVSAENSVLFEKGNLAAALDIMIENYSKFKGQKISKSAIASFSKRVVSEKIIDVLHRHEILLKK